MLRWLGTSVAVVLVLAVVDGTIGEPAGAADSVSRPAALAEEIAIEQDLDHLESAPSSVDATGIDLRGREQQGWRTRSGRHQGASGWAMGASRGFRDRLAS